MVKTQNISSLSRKKQLIFSFVTVLLPIIFLIVVELFLRIIHYGGDLRLVRPIEIYGRKYYQLNSQVGRRYFKSKYLAVPEMYPEVFAYKKPANSFRIFCLGGSTTAGFPFEMNARFTGMLENRLNDSFRGKYSFEVINVGMSAINSFSVLDFMRELIHYEPDLFIIYMGHNEFYGALGVGSTESLGKNRRLILLYLRLNRFRTVRLLREMLFGLKNRIAPENNLRNQSTLMENVVKNKAIPLHSPDYQLVKTYFSKNLQEIISLAETCQAKVLLSTLVENWRDQPPFIANFSDSTSAENKKLWLESFRRAKADLRASRFDSAVVRLNRAIALDANHADGYFYLGKVREKTGDYSSAKSAYQKAVDRDELRFRAGSEWNGVIKKIAAEKHLSLIDMEQKFVGCSPNGLIGHELIYEHLHPNFTGYVLMAQTFYRALRDEELLLPRSEWPDSGKVTVNKIKNLAGITDMDILLADWRIKKLTSRWPFTDNMGSVSLNPDDWQDSLAVAYLQKKIVWSDVHYRAARHFERKGETDLAIAEYKAIAKVRPDAYFPRLRMGTLYLERNLPEMALLMLTAARKLNPVSKAVSYRLGTAYLLTGKLNEAVAQFEFTLRADNRKEVLKPEEIARTHYALALALIQLRRTKDAIPHLEWIEKNQPQFAPGLALLAKIRNGENISVEIGK